MAYGKWLPLMMRLRVGGRNGDRMGHRRKFVLRMKNTPCRSKWIIYVNLIATVFM